MKLSTRILSIIMAVAMIVSSMVVVASAEDAATISLVAGEITDGTVAVDVVVAGNPGINSMKLNINYDEALALVSVEDKGVLGTTYHSDDTTMNPYILFWNNGAADADVTANGVVATLVFTAPEAAGEYAITVDYNGNANMEIFNVADAKVEFALENTAIVVEEVVEPEPDEPVATVGGEQYTTVAAALAAAEAGQTVTMIANSAEAGILVYANTTLDLAGYTLEADYVVGFAGANVLDSSAANTGFLKVAKDNVSLQSSETIEKKATSTVQLPVYDATAGGYYFTTVTFQYQIKETVAATETAAGYSTVMILARPEAAVFTQIKAGSAVSGVSTLFKLAWTLPTATVEQEFKYLDADVSKALTSGALSAKLGDAWLNSGSDLLAAAGLRSNTGVQISTVGYAAVK